MLIAGQHKSQLPVGAHLLLAWLLVLSAYHETCATCAVQRTAVHCNVVHAMRLHSSALKGHSLASDWLIS
jgi:hypothetical protein